MKMMTKKMVAGMAAGAVLLMGGLTYVQAAQDNGAEQSRLERQGKPGHRQPPQMNKDKAAQRIADTFRVDKEEVLTALNNNADFRDVGHAAMLAKISGKSFKDVLAMKTKDNHWSDVQKSLGISREQMKNEMDGLTAARIAERGNVTVDTAKALLKAGYHERDIQAAGFLAKASGREIQSVLDMKKINNRWEDVAKSLGVDAKEFFRGNRGRGGQDGMMPMGEPGGMHGQGDFRGAPPQMPENEQ